MSHHNDKPAHWNDLQWAGYRLIHEFRFGDLDGVEAAALYLGKQKHTLYNEANADYPGAKLGLVDAVHLEAEACQGHPERALLLHAHAAMCGHACWPLPDLRSLVCDTELLSQFAEWQAAIGRTCDELHHAFTKESPGGSRITRAEIAAVKARGFEQIREFMVFLDRLDSISEPERGA